MDNGFYRVSAESRKDQLLRIGEKNWLLIFGFDEDVETGGFNWRKNYSRKPTLSELKSDVEWLVNSRTDEKILSGYVWMGKRVWLSIENQQNYTASYLAGKLPVKVMVYEPYADAQGTVVELQTADELTGFYKGMVEHVRMCVEEGWRVKDSIDYVTLLNQ